MATAVLTLNTLDFLEAESLQQRQEEDECLSADVSGVLTVFSKIVSHFRAHSIDRNKKGAVDELTTLPSVAAVMKSCAELGVCYFRPP